MIVDTIDKLFDKKLIENKILKYIYLSWAAHPEYVPCFDYYDIANKIEEDAIDVMRSVVLLIRKEYVTKVHEQKGNYTFALRLEKF